MEYLIALGANLGDRNQNLSIAVDLLERCGGIVRKSSVYVTAPVGMLAEQDFYNQVVLLKSEVEPLELLQKLMNIERDMGRVRQNEPGYTSRCIDLDILLAEGVVIQTETLQIPHPRMEQRRFVLAPAAEIASEWIHPLIKLSLGELLSACTDEAKVTRL